MRDPFEILVALPWKRIAVLAVAAALLATGARWKLAHDAERRAAREAADRTYWTEQGRAKLAAHCAQHLGEWRELVARRREEEALRGARDCAQFGEEYRDLAHAGERVASDRNGNLCQVLKPRLDELVAQRDHCGFMREDAGDCAAIYPALRPFAAEARARCPSGRA